MKGAPTGRFQASLSDSFAQAHDAQHGAKSHFGMGPALQDPLDQLGATRTDFTGPVDHAAGGPLQIFLVGLGPVFLQGGELTGLKTAHMRRHPFAVVEQLDGLFAQAHIQFGMNERIRSAVVVLINDHVIIDVDSGLLPDGDFIGLSWQGQQEGSNQLSREPSSF